MPTKDRTLASLGASCAATNVLRTFNLLLLSCHTLRGLKANKHVLPKPCLPLPGTHICSRGSWTSWGLTSLASVAHNLGLPLHVRGVGGAAAGVCSRRGWSFYLCRTASPRPFRALPCRRQTKEGTMDLAINGLFCKIVAWMVASFQSGLVAIVYMCTYSEIFAWVLCQFGDRSSP